MRKVLQLASEAGVDSIETRRHLMDDASKFANP